MNHRSQPDPAARQILKAHDGRSWRFTVTRIGLAGRAPDPSRPSIRSAWLRFAGDRPKLAVVRARS